MIVNMKTPNTYRTYSVLVRWAKPENSRFIDVVAVSIEAAIADINEAFETPEIITWSQY